jgi:hypothetical protein
VSREERRGKEGIGLYGRDMRCSGRHAPGPTASHGPRTLKRWRCCGGSTSSLVAPFSVIYERAY